VRPRGRRGGGVGARCGPSSGRQGVNVPVEEERVRGVDLVAVSETSLWTRQRSMRCQRGPDYGGDGHGGGASTLVAGEIIVARVRVQGGAAHLKRRIVVTDGIDYVYTSIATYE
jgi:hypothetical protein